ncbi:M67 family metallopeptidase [Croceicoccus sp. BE223]|uniref:M67 family metallopeptidase n=1 Tax=Croceicoccus sp. BE223 TaxID=2817716 RepID=UPI002866EF70|nr:M67 family metallopeptidase [Croceicoccus sp. BE223]MDR7101842.1 proteasome lid subunit RPN8/RPN11 [Croceicoccus sp. BE223]
MIAEAAAAHPRECCGIMLGRDGVVEAVVPCDNVHPLPEHHFEIDPAALIAAHRAARGDGPDILGYYHSHPSGFAEPSATDAAMAAGDGRFWAIVAQGAVGWWRDGLGVAKAGVFEGCGQPPERLPQD